MGWCPNCQNEYVEGIKICPKCDMQLAPTKEIAINAANALKNQENQTSQNSGYNVQIPAANFVPDEETIKKAIEMQKKMRSSNVYQKKSDKAEDMKSSAISLLVVGIIGLILVALVFFDVIPLHFTLYRKIMVLSVMTVMFVILIVVGLFSIKSFKLLKKSAGEEDVLTSEIQSWYKSALTVEAVDKFVDADGDDEADLYYQRHGIIVRLLNDKFLNLDEGYSEHIVEEIYQWLYEN